MQHKVTTRDAQPSSPSVASLIVNVTGLLVVSAQAQVTGPFILALASIDSSTAVCLGRRQPEPTAVLSGVPSYPRGWELLCVRTSSLHRCWETDKGGILFDAALTTFSVSIMVLDRGGR